MSDTISIIMPVKNGIPYLQECLDSIINQTYDNWELLVVNDNSNDTTQQVLNAYAAIDKRIKPSKSLGLGITDALNSGYDHSTGQYITRMDADDLMPENKLETLYSLLFDKSRPTVATGHVKYFSASGVKNGYKSYETWLNQLCVNNNHFQSIYKECVIASPAWMMRRDHFDSIGGFKSETYPEDYDLCFRMYENGIKVISTDKIVHQWRDHGSRTSRNDPNYADNRFLDLKLDFFRKIEFPKYKSFILIGAGKKGKTVANFFLKNNIKFVWTTNNIKKIGNDIYGVILTDYNLLRVDNLQTAILITVANKQEQAEIKDSISRIDSERIYFLC